MNYSFFYLFYPISYNFRNILYFFVILIPYNQFIITKKKGGKYMMLIIDVFTLTTIITKILKKN